MNKFSIEATAREQLQRAAAGSSGRSATTIYGGHEHRLRQTLVALTAGSSLTEHDNQGEATVYVIHGRIELFGPDTSWTGIGGDLIIVPQARHSVTAHEDSAFLLTVALAS